MPLDPKIQMPYYTIDETLPTPPSASNIRLNMQDAAVQTSGTTETDLYLYTIPPNTLEENGDGLIINFECQTSNNIENQTVRLYLNGTNQLAITVAAPTREKWTVSIVRISTTTAYMVMQIWAADYSGEPQYQIATSIDYTTTIPFKFTGQVTTAAVIETELLTIDKIKMI